MPSPLALAPLPCGLEDASLPAQEDAQRPSLVTLLELSKSLAAPADPGIVAQFKMVWDHDPFQELDL